MSQQASTGFYYGSRLLQPMTHTVGLSIDQINFIACQLVAMLLGIPFCFILHPTRVSPVVRHAAEIICGVSLLYFCFGSQLIHLFMQALLCYGAMLLVPTQVHKACFIISIGYLSVMHIYRLIYDYGGYTLDITGPLMITTQKLSDLGFCIHDGMQKSDDKLSPTQRKYAQRKMPSLMELSSYIFSFHNVMVGPTTFYQDYIDFITGENIGLGKPSYLEAGKYDTPNSATMALKKAAVVVVCTYVVTQLLPRFPVTVFAEEAFLTSSFTYQVLYMLWSVSLIRCKYYFAWSLAELSNISAGFGFTGFKEDGTEDWDMIRNADIWSVETCTSMKLNMDGWNIRTLIWLRRVVYERAPVHNTLAVFAVSALWHGFYPGYYVAFATAALYIFANRSLRRVVRPYFLESRPMKFFYDVVTFIGTRFANVYMAVPILMYELQPTLRMFKAQYFWIHILALAAVLCLPKRPSASNRPKAD